MQAPRAAQRGGDSGGGRVVSASRPVSVAPTQIWLGCGEEKGGIGGWERWHLFRHRVSGRAWTNGNLDRLSRVWKAVLGLGAAGRAPRAHVSQQCGNPRAGPGLSFGFLVFFFFLGVGGTAHVGTRGMCVGTYIVRIRVVRMEIARPAQPRPWGKGYDLPWSRGCTPILGFSL